MGPHVGVAREYLEVGVSVEDFDSRTYGDGCDEAVDQLADRFAAGAARASWHEFDQILYVMSGEAGVENQHGDVVRFGRGTRAVIPARFVHRGVEGDRYRAVVGFSISPKAISEPIERAPSELGTDHR